MMGFGARINDQRSVTTPVLESYKTIYTIDIVRWITSGKAHPEEIIEGGSSKLAVVANDDQTDIPGSVFFRHVCLTQCIHIFLRCFIIGKRCPFHGDYTRHRKTRVAKYRQFSQKRRHFSAKSSDRVSVGCKDYFTTAVNICSRIIKGVDCGISLEVH